MSLINKLFGRKNDQPDVFPVVENAASRQANAKEVDVNELVENPRLKILFEQWYQQRTNDLLNQIFEEIMLRVHFLSVIMLSEEPEPSDDGTAIFRKDTVIKLPMLTTQDGKRFYPAFTDWGELAKWQSVTSPPKTLILSFDDYVAMVLQKEGADGVIINPFGDRFLLDRPLLTHLKTEKELF